MKIVKKSKLIKFSKYRKKKTIKRNNKKRDGLKMRGGLFLLPSFSAFDFRSRKKPVPYTAREEALYRKIKYFRTKIAIAKVQGNSKTYKSIKKINNQVKKNIGSTLYKQFKKKMKPDLAIATASAKQGVLHAPQHVKITTKSKVH